MSKTPVTILQEYCAQKRIVPQYELILNGVGTHDPLFRYKLSVMEDSCLNPVISYGEGKSKKEAKHEAARAAIISLDIQPAVPQNKYVPVESNVPKDFQSPYLGAIKENNVGKLASICCEKMLPTPVYNMIGEEGPPHSKVFTFECCLAHLKEIASSRTKQQAKHLASDKMIKRLTEIINVSEEELLQKKEEKDESKEETDAKEKDMKAKEAYIEVKSKVEKVGSNYGLQVSEYHTIDLVAVCGFHEDFVQTLKNYKNELDDSIDPLHILVSNFANCGKTLTFYKLPTNAPLEICTCQMDTPPQFAVFGSGDTFEEAKRISAHNMLLNLRTYV